MELYTGQNYTDYKIFVKYEIIRETDKSRLVELSSGNSYWISKKYSYIENTKLKVEEWFWYKYLKVSNSVNKKEIK